MKNDEFRLCCALWSYVGSRHPAVVREKKFFAIPNGEYRNAVTASKLKRSGVVPGVSDYLLTVPSSGYTQLWLEVKRESGGKVSPDQKEFMQNHNNSREMAVVGYGFDECRDILDIWLAGRAYDIAWIAETPGKRERNAAEKARSECR